MKTERELAFEISEPKLAMLDGVMLACERQHGPGVPGLQPVATHAQQQVQALLKSLEEHSPEMKANLPSA